MPGCSQRLEHPPRARRLTYNRAGSSVGENALAVKCGLSRQSLRSQPVAVLEKRPPRLFMLLDRKFSVGPSLHLPQPSLFRCQIFK